MPVMDIAFLHEQYQDIIIAPLDTGFDDQSASDQYAALSDIQLASYRAGLRGRAMVIWKTASGATRFICPMQFGAFLTKLQHAGIVDQLNLTLSWKMAWATRSVVYPRRIPPHLAAV
jgi:hypothetical protein